MRVVVTGGSGFIGQHVVAGLRARGDEVSVIDLKPFPDPDIRCIVGDIRDKKAVAEALVDSSDGVVHLAAITSVLQSVNNPDLVFTTNMDGTHNLLERCREVNIKRFVLASTNAVVGNVGATVIDEETPLRPLTPYGATKAAAEMLLSAYGASYDMTTVALRFTNVFGAGMQVKDSVIARLMRAALSGGGIEIYGDGEQLRDYLYVTDIAAGILMGLGLADPAVLCIGLAESVSLNTLHRLACEVTGVDIKKTYVDGKPGEMPAVIVSTKRAAAMGFSPAYSIRDGLAATWKDFQSHA